jgi:hypothetical protein
MSNVRERPIANGANKLVLVSTAVISTLFTRMYVSTSSQMIPLNVVRDIHVTGTEIDGTGTEIVGAPGPGPKLSVH